VETVKQDQMFNQLHLLYPVSLILSMAQEHFLPKSDREKPVFNFTSVRLDLWWRK